ncbi:hypothetical protein LZ32DRAFT_139561 [Colletotrichum eremochloae]|nr:hypothetical protein LZ32DRAFT_139561 [Colletotrichum eremochloae]
MRRVGMEGGEGGVPVLDSWAPHHVCRCKLLLAGFDCWSASLCLRVLPSRLLASPARFQLVSAALQILWFVLGPGSPGAQEKNDGRGRGQGRALGKFDRVKC